MSGFPVPNFVVAPPNAEGSYVSATPATWNAQPVVAWTPGLPVAQGTIITQAATGPTLPGSGYHVALQNTVLGATPPVFFQSDDFFHFTLGPSE